MSNRNIITCVNKLFTLDTLHTTYMFRVDDYGHLEHIHYGDKVCSEDAQALSYKRSIGFGDSINYTDKDSTYCLDTLPLEWSGYGRGDYRESPIELETNFGKTTDFIFKSYSIDEETYQTKSGLPLSYDSDMNLRIELVDLTTNLELVLVYSVYYSTDVITRRCVLTNNSSSDIVIHKLMSYSLDINEENLDLLTFGGSWANETHLIKRPIVNGTIVNQSRTGFSSNRNNPGFILAGNLANENNGKAWGFNLIYTGNHYSSINCDVHNSIRIQGGISPQDFSLTLAKQDFFETPEVVMTYSDSGLNTLSQQFHNFINQHIIRGYWKNVERPVLVNSWEAYMFKFNQKKLLDLARTTKDIGGELFVLDDGWFGERNDDTAGLGDYFPNKKKLPFGINGLSERVHQMGLKFGLWFEPEAINPKSDLYKNHPDWAIHDRGRSDVYGRNELLLDLTKQEVRDYIVASVTKIIDEAKIDYVKWDMNRQLCGVDGAFDYQYILGLYEVLKRIFEPRPQVLLESCSSGGNRFDLGMLCFSPQIWTSDDTDPIERLDIQKGCSYLYPLSTMGSHVAAIPSAQTLRKTPLATRFNVACYGDLGYELDLNKLSKLELDEIKKQIIFYKQHRRTFQFGDFYRYDDNKQRENFSVVSKDLSEAIATKFRRLLHASCGYEKLRVNGLTADSRYSVVSREFQLNISDFGHLISYALPVKLNADGLIMRSVTQRIGLPAAKEVYSVSGSGLATGICLANVFNGAGYNSAIRLPGDFGSEMYIVSKEK